MVDYGKSGKMTELVDFLRRVHEEFGLQINALEVRDFLNRLVPEKMQEFEQAVPENVISTKKAKDRRMDGSWQMQQPPAEPPLEAILEKVSAVGAGSYEDQGEP